MAENEKEAYLALIAAQDPQIRGFCRKVRFLGQNPKIGYQKFNDLQTAKLSKKQLCDRTGDTAGRGATSPTGAGQSATRSFHLHRAR